MRILHIDAQHIDVHSQKAGDADVKRADNHKIIRFDEKQGKMGRKGRKRRTPNRSMQQHAEDLRAASAIDHLLPVTFPHGEPDADPTRLANVPWSDIGTLYVLEMRRLFPNRYFVDTTLRTCRADRMKFQPLGVPEDESGLIYRHDTDTDFERLRVPITRRGRKATVFAANIIADPFGLEVFSSIVEKFPHRYFQTTEFDSIPISYISMNEIASLNFPE